MELPGYDDWKTHNPDDDRCEFCGAHERECRAGWEPDRCTGKCGHVWRDPDAERDRMIEDAADGLDRYSDDDF
jgi:hypothetical protein